LSDVTSTLTTLIIDSISNHSSLLDSFVVVYAAFVSSIHKIIGTDFAAHFVQHAVALYERYHPSTQASPTISESTFRDVEGQEDGKECSNLLVLVSELYNFQVISSVLVFDIIRALLDGDLTEFNVELLLKLLRSKPHAHARL
jgi:nucleolar MIF4G domain-containing protein 1